MRTILARSRGCGRHHANAYIDNRMRNGGRHHYYNSRRVWSCMSNHQLLLVSSSASRSILGSHRSQHFGQQCGIATTTAASTTGTGIIKTKEEKQEQRRLNYLRSYVFKYRASVQVFLEYPDLSEGELTAKRNVLVAAAQHEDRLRSNDHQIEISEAILEDVANQSRAMLLVPGCQNDQIEMMLSNLGKSLPMKDVETLLEIEAIRGRQTALDQDILNIKSIQKAEKLLQYEFQNKALLKQALTRTSVETGKSTYQRLEFLGDAIIDYIIAVRLFSNTPIPDDNTISLTTMHAALANYSLLAYLAMKLSTTSSTIDHELHQFQWQTVASNVPPSTTQRLVDHMVIFPDLPQAQQRIRAEKTYMKNAKDIDAAFSHSTDNVSMTKTNNQTYPWTPLQSISTSKVYSDIIESTTAATFIDTGGDLTQCSNLLLHTIGLINPLEKIESSPNDFDTRPPLFRLCMLKPDLEVRRSHAGSLSKGTKRWVTRLSVKGSQSHEDQDREELACGVSDISAAHADCLAAEDGLDWIYRVTEDKKIG